MEDRIMSLHQYRFNQGIEKGKEETRKNHLKKLSDYFKESENLTEEDALNKAKLILDEA